MRFGSDSASPLSGRRRTFTKSGPISLLSNVGTCCNQSTGITIRRKGSPFLTSNKNPKNSSGRRRQRLITICTADRIYDQWRRLTKDTSFLFLFRMKHDSYPSPADFAVLPRAPKNSSPVPGLTSIYHERDRGDYGDPRYPGNCSGNLIRDLLRYFQPGLVFDPMTGSGTCGDVCAELDVPCISDDLRSGLDVSDPNSMPDGLQFDFIWLHPPYWRQKRYSNDPRDLSTCETLETFLTAYRRVIDNCACVLTPGGKLAILMGDYCDRDAGFVPLTYYTKQLAFRAGLRQSCTDIVRFSHGASSAKKSYRSSFIPGLHDVCTIFERPVRQCPTS